MSNELIINASLPETRIALMEDGEIQDMLIERASGKGIVGNIYKGRVTRVLPGMQAAFVDIGLEKAAFLYVDDVFVHSEVFEEEEEAEDPAPTGNPDAAEERPDKVEATAGPGADAGEPTAQAAGGAEGQEVEGGEEEVDEAEAWAEDLGDVEGDIEGDEDEDEEEDDEPARMGPGGDGEGGSDQPPGTVSPQAGSSGSGGEGGTEGGPAGESPADREGRRRRRGRRGGRFRRDREKGEAGAPGTAQADALGGGAGIEAGSSSDSESGEMHGSMHGSFNEHVSDEGDVDSDRSSVGGQAGEVAGESNRPQAAAKVAPVGSAGSGGKEKPEFREQRDRGRRIKPKASAKGPRVQANIQDLLKEGQEVLVQVAKDPIATKGARLTCHISLPGRHLVCMPTIDHVGVSRRIERDEERRRLRDTVEKNRPKGLGFIVRTASGKQQASAERAIKQDIEYLSRLWIEIRDKAASVTAPALVYEDLNSVLRAIRDWVTEDIDKIVVDSRYHYNDIQRFVSHFMPALKQKVELYHGDIPIFDAYNISNELSRALERKVWLKSGGYLVIDQAEALVAIDVNTGRYVGKKSLEDTILKTNLEAVQEIAYQLRLRNCGGIIILDLIDMEKEENKQRVYRALEEALKKDRARPSILKISELGLVEMTRKRTRDTMVRALCESCSHCEGKGFVKSKTTVAYEILRDLERQGIEREVNKFLIQAHTDVIDVLAIEERETLDQLERRYRKSIFLQAVADHHPEQFEITTDKESDKGKKKETRATTGRDAERGERGERGRRGGRDRGRSDQGQGGSRGGRDRGGQSGGGSGGSGSGSGEKIVVRGRGTPQVGADSAGGVQAPQQGDSPTEGMNDEDRLAYLRAQATQDAALARGGAAAPGAEGGGAGGPRPDRGGERGGRRRRGRRGGKNRGRDRDRTGAPGGAQAFGDSNGTGGGAGSEGRSEGRSEGGGSSGGSADAPAATSSTPREPNPSNT